MKNSKVIVGLFLIGALIAYFFYSKEDRVEQGPSTLAKTSSPESIQDQTETKQENSQTSQSAKKALKKGPHLEEKLNEHFKEISKEHRRSLIQTTQIIYKYSQELAGKAELINQLRDLGASPLVMKDENPYTGSMNIIRTKAPLAGTRYFHAQYFDDEQGDDYVQHMSFEFRPGEKSFEAVKLVVQQTFQLGAPQVQKDHFVSWEKGERHVVWIKKLSKQDMKDDPFNAYSDEDIGTIRVAVELEIHGQGPAFHMQQGED